VAKEYTAAELQEIGRKTVESRRKRQSADAEKRKTLSKLWKLYKEGKIKL